MLKNINIYDFDGRICYFSGGSSGSYKTIFYTKERWLKSVNVTAEVLSAYGVDKNSKVVIMQPFSPWAIGSVFADAALSCGAEVYPIGLYAGDSVFQSFIRSVNPTHLCGSIRNLIKWKKAIDISAKWSVEHKIVSFVAGENFSDNDRMLCEHLWNCSVVNIYGMSEFDTVAAQCKINNDLVLNPYLQYALLVDREIVGLKKNRIGELLIKENVEDSWYSTGDYVNVTDENTTHLSLWQGSKKICFISRLNESATLSDGTEISSVIIDYLRERFPNVSFFQCVISDKLEGHCIEIRFLEYLEFEGQVSGEDILTVFTENIDILDAIKHEIIIELRSVKIGSMDGFITTDRGKTPLIIKTNYEY